KDDKKGGNVPSMTAFADLGLIQSGQNIANETEVLKSKGLMRRVLSALSLQVSYFAEGTVKTTELYGSNLPLKLTVSSIDSTAYEADLKIKPTGNNQFQLLENGKSVGTYRFGNSIQRPYGSFTVTAVRSITKDAINVVFNDMHKLANYYSREI